jgi:hypothetical protein
MDIVYQALVFAFESRCFILFLGENIVATILPVYFPQS